MQEREVEANAVVYTPDMIAEFLRFYNFDTLAAAMELRNNPSALPKDAAVLNSLAVHSLLKSVSPNDERASRVTISRALHLLLLTSWRIRRTVTKFANLKYEQEQGRDNKNNLAHLIRQYQPKEMLMYMLSWQMALQESQEHLKDVAFEIMMCLRFREQPSDATVARYYFC